MFHAIKSMNIGSMTPIIDKKVLVVHIWYIYLYMAKPDLHWSKILTHIGNNDLKFWHAFDSMFWNFGMLLTQWSEILACFGFNDLTFSLTLDSYDLTFSLTLDSMLWNFGSLWIQCSETLAHFGFNEQTLWIQWTKTLDSMIQTIEQDCCWRSRCYWFKCQNNLKTS